jgi:hypothetical protein
MKKTIILFLLSVISITLGAQEKNCSQAISNQQFQSKLNQIKSKNNDQKRLQFAKQIVLRDCLSCAQIKEIATLFENDYIRFEFAKNSYKNATDKENFYDVYDAFIYYSVVFKLHDYVTSVKKPNTNTTVVIPNKIVFPNYKYPLIKNYQGVKNCERVLYNKLFLEKAQQIKKIESAQKRYIKAIAITKNNCLSTAQIMKISSLIENENYKLNFAKEAYKFVYDVSNYIEMKQTFITPRLRAEFVSFINNQTTINTNICAVPNQEYNKIVATIKNENFNSAKLKTAKHLIQSKKCFSPIQIKGIVNLFDYENSRIEIAFLAYNHTENKSDYYSIVSQAFGFESSKKRLLDYIKNQN